jgi:hypothetical protein
VPDWAVKVVQSAVREYRYTGEYLPDKAEDVLIGIRRAHRRLGMIRIRHTLRGPLHRLRIEFEPLEGPSEAFIVRSLKQLQEHAPLLMERVCRHGMSKDPRWCEDCAHKDRHMQGLFRGLTRPEEAPPEPRGPQRPSS